MTEPTTNPSRPMMWCKRCSLPLDGSSERRCPRCRRRFDPDRPRTFLVKPRGRFVLTRKLSVINKLLVIAPAIVMWLSLVIQFLLAFTNLEQFAKWDRTLTAMRRGGAYTFLAVLLYTIVRYIRAVDAEGKRLQPIWRRGGN